MLFFAGLYVGASFTSLALLQRMMTVRRYSMRFSALLSGRGVSIRSSVI